MSWWVNAAMERANNNDIAHWFCLGVGHIYEGSRIILVKKLLSVTNQIIVKFFEIPQLFCIAPGLLSLRGGWSSKHGKLILENGDYKYRSYRFIIYIPKRSTNVTKINQKPAARPPSPPRILSRPHFSSLYLVESVG